MVEKSLSIKVINRQLDSLPFRDFRSFCSYEEALDTKFRGLTAYPANPLCQSGRESVTSCKALKKIDF